MMSQVLIISYAKFHQHGFRDVGLLPLKNRKFVFSGINFPQISSLKRFFAKFIMGRESQVRTLMLNFTIVALEMQDHYLQNCQLLAGLREAQPCRYCFYSEVQKCVDTLS